VPFQPYHAGESAVSLPSASTRFGRLPIAVSSVDRWKIPNSFGVEMPAAAVIYGASVTSPYCTSLPVSDEPTSAYVMPPNAYQPAALR